MHYPNFASEKSVIQIHVKEIAFMMSDFRVLEHKSRRFFGQYHTKTTMLHEMWSATATQHCENQQK